MGDSEDCIMTDAINLVPEIIDVDAHNSYKRPSESNVNRQAAKRSALEKVGENTNSDYSLRVTLVDSDANFIDINWVKACEFIDEITPE